MAENIRPYIIINGKSSREISGLLIVSLPPITKSQMRVSAEEIDGRDGDIVTELGFSAYDKPVEIGLAGDYDINEVISYFNQAGIITFSNEPDKYYKFAQYNGIDFEKLIRFKTATVIFHVQPFKYDTESNDAVFWNPENISITNEGNIYSKPELAIQGSGNVGINVNGSEVLSIAFGETKQAIIIDTDKMNAYGTKSNVKELITDINPVLDTNGYDSVWIGGAGKNKLNCTATTQTVNGVTFTVVKNNKNQVVRIDVTGTATAGTSFAIGTATIASGTYVFNGYVGGSGVGTKYINYSGITNAYGSNITTTINETKTTNVSLQIANGAETGFTIYPMIRLSNTADGFEPYENIGEITGWDDCEIELADENMQEISTTQIDFLENTVYGGSLNVTTGLLTVTHAIVDLSTLNWIYASSAKRWEALKANMKNYPSRNADIIFEKYETDIGATVGSEGKGFISGLVIYVTSNDNTTQPSGNACYPLANPIEIQLTAEEIQTIIGTNKIRSNTGDISECIYIKDGVEITTSGEIVTVEVDAVDLNDSILKNRLVTGNYDNLRLKAGTNQIGITGDVDVLVLSNFSRWL